MSLYQLLYRDARAAEFYASLHPSVKRVVDQSKDAIHREEDLSAIANNAMTEALKEFSGIYDDSDTWPD